jgi:glycosyltransferase involved in cell wall biosynthesis
MHGVQSIVAFGREEADMAKVDVVIPCYNYGHFLTDCVQSVLTQEGVEVRALVIDDGSIDNTAEVARALSVLDSRVELISLPRNVGMIPAINRGISELSGEYFVKLDADDLLTPGSLRRSVTLLERFPNVGFVYGRPRHFTGVLPPRGRWGVPHWTIWSGAEWFALRCRVGVNCISQPEAVIRKSALLEMGGYNAGLPHTSDIEMWLRLSAVMDVGRVNGVDQGYYRVHANSMQRTVNAGPMKDLVGRREAFASAFCAKGDRLRDAAELEETVRRKLAAEALDRACRTYDRDRVDPQMEVQLVEFAMTTYPGFTSLPEWLGLQRRRQRGHQSRWMPRSLLAAGLRRIREEIAYLRWVRTGV